MQAHHQHYLEYGYCVVPNVVPSELIQTVYQEVLQVIGQQHARFGLVCAQTGDLEKDCLESMRLLLNRDVQAYLSTLRLLAKLPSVRRLTASPSIESVVRNMGCAVPTIPESPVFHVISEQLRIPNGYFGFEPHQDWTSIQGALDVMVCWVPLVDVSATNFPLMLVPESHKKGMLPGEIEDNAYKVDQSCIQEDQFVSVVANAGDIVLMTGWTIHKTGVDGCAGFRLALSNRWEDASEPHFVERNYPCAYKKYVHREWITPGFPDFEQIQEALKMQFDKR